MVDKKNADIAAFGIFDVLVQEKKNGENCKLATLISISQKHS